MGDLDPEAAALLAEGWRRLAVGATDRRSPFHTLTLATLGGDRRPRARSVTLRAADREQRLLRFHADRRSEKIAELLADPRFALHGYDADGRLQLRLEGEACIHHGDEVASQAWAASQPMSRQCYGTEPGPGTAIAAALAYGLPEQVPVDHPAFGNFCAVLARIDVMDVLTLAVGAHRRLTIVWGEHCRANWRAP